MPRRGKRTPLSAKNQSKKSPKWNGDISTLTLLGHGTTGLVFALSRTTVVKVPLPTPHSQQAIDTERRIYALLSRSKEAPPNILTCLDYSSPYGLVLTRCDSTLRSRLLLYAAKFVPSLPAETLKWARQASSALSFLHGHSIVHADVGCHNMLLCSSSSDIQLCDFAGSGLPGYPATVCYEPRSKLLGTVVPDQKSDIFALGCAFFEMETLAIPYAEMPLPMVADCYRAEKFPDTVGLLMGKVVRSCWKDHGYKNVRQALEEITILESSEEMVDQSREKEQESAQTTRIRTSKQHPSKSKPKSASTSGHRSVATQAPATYYVRPSREESKNSKRIAPKERVEDKEKHSSHRSGFALHDLGLRLSRYLRTH